MTDTDDDLLRLAFSGVNPVRLIRLLPGGAPQTLRVVMADPRLSREAREAVGVGSEERRRQLAEANIEFYPLAGSADHGMPADSPAWLFARGDLPSELGVAVVGSRRATAYGLRTSQAIGAALAQAGVPVVSGMALGVDGAAHRGCIDAGGLAVAVLGSGVDVPYPARHRVLSQEIVRSGGVLLSEYPPGTRPAPWRFPLRNRIIAGLSRAVVVVEAAARSGALITARIALDMNLDVFAVPGDIDRLTSQGCNQLIRDGAHPVSSVEELIEGLGFVEGRKERSATELGLFEGERVPVDEVIARNPGWPASQVMARIGLLELDGGLVVDGAYVEVPGRRRTKP